MAYSVVLDDGGVSSFRTFGNFAVSDDFPQYLYMRQGIADGDLPRVYGWRWQPVADNSASLDGVDFDAYQPVCGPEDVEVLLPEDCMSGAQIVASGCHDTGDGAFQRFIGFDEPADLLTQPGVEGPIDGMEVGDSYILIHSSSPGDFHTATVIQQDGDVNITMEADTTATGSNPNGLVRIFDMYSEDGSVAADGQSFFARTVGTGGDVEQAYRLQLEMSEEEISLDAPNSMLGSIVDGMEPAAIDNFGAVADLDAELLGELLALAV